MEDEHPLTDEVNDIVGSPSTLPMAGHDLSAEDIQVLLGVMGESTAAVSMGQVEEATAQVPSVSSTNLTAEISSEAKAQARTERKRSREKQRRVDVNYQFQHLTEVLRGLETKYASSIQVRPPLAPSNRADLIARVVLLLEDLDQTIDRGVQERQDLQEQLQRAQQAGEEAAAKLKESLMVPQNMGQNRVMMMVPMMIQGDQAAAMGFPGVVPASSTAAVTPGTAPTAVSSMPSTAPTSMTTSTVAASASMTPCAPSAVAEAPAAPVMMMPQMMVPSGNMMMAPQAAMPHYFIPQVAPPKESKREGSASSGTSHPGSNLAHCA